MTLDQYLKKYKKTSEFAKSINVPPSLISQWRHKVRPIPFERIMDIEIASNGLVSRKDIRPSDWQKHWPELAEEKQAVNE